ncbi:MAG: hypothetical protein OQK72_10555, partial [Gammaproteobacteria bacterium]|nr:hypothetical protein [Gammaproteobacteria bacterium]
DIQPNNGVNRLYEEYSWWSIEAGIQTKIYQNNKQSIKLEIGLLHTLDGYISIDLRPQGYGYPELSLGSKSGFNSNLLFNKKISDNNDFYLKINYKHWKFGKSNSQTLSNGFSSITITEPRSESNHSSISLGFITHF